MRERILSDWAEEAVDVVTAAGRILLEGLSGDRSIRFKGEIDLVTEMDTRVESFIAGELARRFPGTSLLAEEGSVTGESDADGLWILDPLDGTTNYAHGFPVFCVSLALELEGRLELAVVHDPTRLETFVARRGVGATLNGRALSVSTTDELGRALLATGFPYDIRESDRNNLAEFNGLAVRARGIRRAGSAALDLAYVAAGRLDAYWEDKIAVWDVAAGVLLVEEAGGSVTHYDGSARDIRRGRILATNGRLQAAMQAALAEIGAGTGHSGA